MKTYKILKFILPFLFACFFLQSLQGCAAVAVGAIAAGAAGTTTIIATDPRSSGVIVDDNTTETKLHLNFSQNLSDANIYVNSYNGVVLLSGQAPTEATKSKAGFTTKAMPGVKQLYNYLDVRLPQSYVARSEDTFTTAQVRAKILSLKGVSSNNIKVITTNSVVYLLGVLSVDQAKQVANVAAKTNGVSKVVTLFEYVSN
ncbi:MAG TPA: BON domain-containing protein [Burkholderiales bacterium]|nr:BON domain-containing protein [Burkholderiales bacterium]